MKELNKEQLDALSLMMLEGLTKKDPAIIKGCLALGGSADHAVVSSGYRSPRPLLHWAALNFDAATADIILEATSNIDLKDSQGNTALMIAIQNQKPEAVEFLMKHGANPLEQNDAGTVPLEAARTLQTDYYNANIRDRIIKAMTADYGHQAIVAQMDNEIRGAGPSVPPPPKPPKGFTL